MPVVRGLTGGLALVFHVGLGPALGASPAPTGPGSDTRSTGEGAGLVGEPLLAIGLVILIAVAALLVALAYVRLTARGQDASGEHGARHRD